jgi:tRNA(Ile)-lysidine synthase
MDPLLPLPEALLLRPLLGVAPARLEAVVAAAGLRPVRDPSNTDPRFRRVRMRAALDEPGGEGPRTAELAAAATRFAARRRAREAEVAARLAVAATLHEEGFAQLDLALLGRDAVAVAALRALLRVVGGARFAPAARAVVALLERGEGTLAGALLRRGGLLLREEAGLAAPVAAAMGATWDARFRLREALPGLLLGAAGASARRLPRPGWMPAGVAPTLPALWREGTLAALPALAYPARQDLVRIQPGFAPVAGSAT